MKMKEHDCYLCQLKGIKTPANNYVIGKTSNKGKPAKIYAFLCHFHTARVLRSDPKAKVTSE